MGILSWIVFGLVVGMLAKFLLPGKDPGGFVVTVLLGVVGAVVGGFIGAELGFASSEAFSAEGLAIATGGAILVLYGYRLVRKLL